MEYKYAKKESYENFASGRVLYGFPGISNFPVRIAIEVFGRCRNYISKEKDIVLYDPCCGGAYSLTVLGFVYNDILSSIYASDINKTALEIANKNLSLLSFCGLENRKNKLEDDFKSYHKQVHKDALESISYFKEIIKSKEKQIEIECFSADVNDLETFKSLSIKADIIFTDIPYGNLVTWGGKLNCAGDFLDALSNVISRDSVVAISYNKNQKFNSDKYDRLERIRVGKRLIDIFKIKEL